MPSRNKAGALRGDLQRLALKLEALPDGSIVADADGDAWQRGFPGYWYRSFGDSSFVDSFAGAQRMRSATVLRKGWPS